MTKNKDDMHQDCVKPLFHKDNLFTFCLRRITDPVSILSGCELEELDVNYKKNNYFYTKKNSTRGHEEELFFLLKFSRISILIY